VFEAFGKFNSCGNIRLKSLKMQGFAHCGAKWGKIFPFFILYVLILQNMGMP
jgi:hypothetical protein